MHKFALLRENKKVVFAFKALVIIVGCSFYALAVTLFISPNKLMTGGLTGIALITNRLLGFPVGIAIIVLNVPLFIMGFKILGKRFIAGSFAGMVISSILIDVFEKAIPAVEGLTDDRLLAACFGGAFMGIGLGLVLSAGSNTGGTDILAILIGKKAQSMPLGRLILMADIVIVSGGTMIFGDYIAALYTFVAMYISSAALDAVLYGANTASVAFIITAEREAVTNELIGGLKRGVTMLDARGGYTKKDTGLLICSIGRRQVAQLKKIVRESDPGAFVIISEAKEVMGNGFRERK